MELCLATGRDLSLIILQDGGFNDKLYAIKLYIQQHIYLIAFD